MSGESGLLRRKFDEMKREMRAKIECEVATRKAAEAMAKEAMERRSEPTLQQPMVPEQHMERGYHSRTGTCLFKSHNGMRGLKFIDGQELHLWSNRFGACFISRGLIGTI